MTPGEEGTRRIKIKSEDFNLPPQGQSIGNNTKFERERIQGPMAMEAITTRRSGCLSQNYYNNRKVVTVIVKATFRILGGCEQGGVTYKNPWPTILAGESEAKKKSTVIEGVTCRLIVTSLAKDKTVPVTVINH